MYRTMLYFPTDALMRLYNKYFSSTDAQKQHDLKIKTMKLVVFNIILG